MAIAQHDSGTKNFSGDVGDTWDVIQATSPDTTDGVFQFFVDLNALAAGDTLEIRIREKTTGTGDTARVLLSAELAGAQAQPLWVSPSVILLHGWEFEMRQRAGTGRSIPWSIRKVS